MVPLALNGGQPQPAGKGAARAEPRITVDRKAAWRLPASRAEALPRDRTRAYNEVGEQQLDENLARQQKNG